MVFDIIPVRPNGREQYQNRVSALCALLIDDTGKRYRTRVFRLLTLSGNQASRLLKSTANMVFRDHPYARSFLRDYPADVRAQEIMSELDSLYSGPEDEIDHLRGAVGEVFSYLLCQKVHLRADIEVKVRINAWTSDSIDAAGCSRRRGHCFQSKCSGHDPASIAQQKADLDAIEQLTAGKAEGFFVTFVDLRGFFGSLRSSGIDPTGYKVLDRTELAAAERRLTPPS